MVFAQRAHIYSLNSKGPHPCPGLELRREGLRGLESDGAVLCGLRQGSDLSEPVCCESLTAQGSWRNEPRSQVPRQRGVDMDQMEAEVCKAL